MCSLSVAQQHTTHTLFPTLAREMSTEPVQRRAAVAAHESERTLDEGVKQTQRTSSPLPARSSPIVDVFGLLSFRLLCPTPFSCAGAAEQLGEKIKENAKSLWHSVRRLDACAHTHCMIVLVALTICDRAVFVPLESGGGGIGLVQGHDQKRTHARLCLPSGKMALSLRRLGRCREQC
jgi:hypothetical protein